jgi:hypothetical protein
VHDATQGDRRGRPVRLHMLRVSWARGRPLGTLADSRRRQIVVEALQRREEAVDLAFPPQLWIRARNYE